MSEYSQSLGQSNSIVEIVNSNLEVRVRKSSHTRNVRFIAQYKKHKKAEVSFMSPIKVPKILEVIDDYSYEMEYVRGIPLGRFLEICDQEELATALQKLVEYFRNILDSSKFTSSSSLHAAINEKLGTLSAEINLGIGISSVFEDLLAYCKENIQSILVPEGWNHGDFSFENILVGQYSYEVFALDFLDSPFETPLIDLGRMWLDSKFGWWAAGLHPSSSMLLNSNVLSKSISEICVEFSIPEQSLEIFAALAILRIRPYTTNPLRMAFLKHAAVQILGGTKLRY